MGVSESRPMPRPVRHVRGGRVIYPSKELTSVVSAFESIPGVAESNRVHSGADGMFWYSINDSKIVQMHYCNNEHSAVKCIIFRLVDTSGAIIQELRVDGDKSKKDSYIMRVLIDSCWPLSNDSKTPSDIYTRCNEFIDYVVDTQFLKTKKHNDAVLLKIVLSIIKNSSSSSSVFGRVVWYSHKLKATLTNLKSR